MNKILEWNMPIHTVSEANVSQHWTKKKKRNDIQKRWVWVFFQREGHFIPLPCHIKLIRVGKKLLDDDNLPVSMKHVRDCIADKLIPGLPPGKADGDPRLSWSYDQQTGKEYAVIVQFFDLE